MLLQYNKYILNLNIMDKKTISCSILPNENHTQIKYYKLQCRYINK